MFLVCRSDDVKILFYNILAVFVIYLSYNYLRPKLVEYTGYSDVALACGPCAAGTKDSTCKDCTGATAGAGAKACNVLEKAGKDFDCYSYSYTAPAKDAPKTDLGTYKLGKAVACHRLEGTAIKCQK